MPGSSELSTKGKKFSRIIYRRRTKGEIPTKFVVAAKVNSTVIPDWDRDGRLSLHVRLTENPVRIFLSDREMCVYVCVYVRPENADIASANAASYGADARAETSGRSKRAFVTPFSKWISGEFARAENNRE